MTTASPSNITITQVTNATIAPATSSNAPSPVLTSVSGPTQDTLISTIAQTSAAILTSYVTNAAITSQQSLTTNKDTSIDTAATTSLAPTQQTSPILTSLSTSAGKLFKKIV